MNSLNPSLLSDTSGQRLLSQRPRSYWDKILASVVRPWAVKVSVAYLMALSLLAVLIPFIANSRPYTVVVSAHDSMPATRLYPLFRSLTRLDLIVLVWAGAVVWCLLHQWLTRAEADLVRRRARRWRVMILAALAAIALTTLISIFRHNVLDVTNYKRLVAEGKAHGAIFAPIDWGYADMEPLSRDLINKMPMPGHPLGTDGQGRDVLARLLWSARVAMSVGFVSQIIALVIGVFCGAIDGYFSGIVDLLFMRFVEAVEAIPTLILILIFVATFGRNIMAIMVILGVTGWTGYARFVRAEFLRLRSLDYVAAARAAGLPLWRVLFRYMLPNGITPVLVSASFGFAGAVTIESGLSFLGVGVRPPTASWGQMLNEAGNPATVFRWWEAIGPGLAIFLTVMAFNVIGQALRDAIDPHGEA